MYVCVLERWRDEEKMKNEQKNKERKADQPE